jgi:branched-chain amino acid transport system ATP-binding protein
VRQGEVVVILGANGAGKTTTIRAICQMVETTGTIKLNGSEITGKSTTDIARAGVAHVPQGRGTSPDLSVEDNLMVGAFTRKDKAGVIADKDNWFSIFPRLAERRAQLAGSLSGGEQQMLAVARALMSRPKVLLLDEPSLGLAPIIVQDLFKRLGTLNKEQGITMLVVEQNANLAFDIADRAYVLEVGEIALSGTADQLRSDDAVRRAYLGY